MAVRTLTPELTTELVDLAEQLRALGVARFALDGFTVEFRPDAPAGVQTVTAGALERVEGAPPAPRNRREQYAAVFGDLPKWPGSDESLEDAL